MDYSSVKALIRERSGLSFETERMAVLADGVRSRMTSRGMRSEEEYLACLRGEEAEFRSLVNLLTINETYFFREPLQLDLLADELLGEMLAAKVAGEPIRILCAGCSTGEEPYSVMMKILERYGPGIQGLIEVIGADIDTEVLRRAEEGFYGRLSFRGFPAALRGKYFEAAEKRYRIRKEVKRKVRFVRLNLMSDVYPEELAGVDVIFYRNVSIYFDPETQRKIFANLAGLLKEKGWLFVSATETLSHNHGVMQLIDRNGVFCYQKGRETPLGERRKAPSLSARPMARRPAIPPRPARSAAAPLPAAQPSGPTFEEALALAKDKNDAGALAATERLLAREPDHRRGQMLKAGLLLNLNRLKEAEEVCLASLAGDRWCLEAHLLLGLVAKLQEEHDGAVRRFKEAVYIRSSCWLAHFFLAEIGRARPE
ncbi:MAG: hypothetical protein M0017_13070, partial [Desulfobacteraceae bacterium]|nr:hypothetical protein [Desulfobacteraceae bacterium]